MKLTDYIQIFSFIWNKSMSIAIGSKPSLSKIKYIY